MLKFDYSKYIKGWWDTDMSSPNVIPVVKQMVDMYEKYRSDIYKEAEDTKLMMEFRVDPVLKFVAYVLTNNTNLKWGESEGSFSDLPEDVQMGILRYITAVFYSVKGSTAVFYKLTDFFGFIYTSPPTYTQKKLDFELADKDGEGNNILGWITEETRFINYFTNFLLELLFVGKGEVLDDSATFGMDAITMRINDDVYIRASIDVDLYRYHISTINNGS